MEIKHSHSAQSIVSNRKIGRVEFFDLARGFALIAMTLFHFGWDLEMFGIAEKGFASQPAMVWFARVIASSFLILVGVSLVLAHNKGFNRNNFIRRFLMVAGAAALITLATYFATPDGFIFFGILHNIALASVIGLLFLRLPWWINSTAAALVFCAALWWRTPLLDAPIWWWTGLSQYTPKANDYVPIFPFFSAVLVGIAGAQMAIAKGWMVKLAYLKSQTMFARMLKFIGRHSLLYYLVHQPVMISILYVFYVLI